jgi:hypothetical protein
VSEGLPSRMPLTNLNHRFFLGEVFNDLTTAKQEAEKQEAPMFIVMLMGPRISSVAPDQ